MINKCPKNDCIAQVFTAYCQFNCMCIELVLIFNSWQDLRQVAYVQMVSLLSKEIIWRERYKYIFLCRHTTLYQSKEKSVVNLQNWYHFMIFCEFSVFVVINYAKFAQVFIASLTKVSCNFFTLATNLNKVIMIWLNCIINVYYQKFYVVTSKVPNFKEKCLFKSA